MTNLDRLHILIAEDDADDSEIIQESFEKHNAFIKVDVVKNGKELVDFFKNGNTTMPDVILTDINMPIMSGIEALKQIHEDEKLRHIHTFVYSTTIDPNYKTKCMEYGTKGFLIKPFSLQGFYEIPDQIIALLKQ